MIAEEDIVIGTPLFTIILTFSILWGLFFLEVTPLPPIRDPFPTPPTLRAPDPLTSWIEMDAKILASVAKGEDPFAPIAVMWTILNRSSAWDKPIFVIVDRGSYHGWELHPKKRWTNAADEAQFKELQIIAEEVLIGRFPDPTGGATHFHREGTAAPIWAPPPGKWRKFGRHFFYKERKVK